MRIQFAIVAVAVCALAAFAGCAAPERAIIVNAAEQDFEQLWDYGEPARSEARFRAELARHPPGTEAHAQLVALTERTPDPNAKKWLVALYNNIGWTYHDQKHYTAALALFEKALAAAEERGRPEAVRIAKWTIARCLRSLGRVEEALARQLALRDDPAGASANDGYVHEEIGENLLVLGRAVEAGRNFARAHALLKDDRYLQANEPQRLARLCELGEGR